MKLRGLSKWVDNRFRKIGFIKHSESDRCVIYEKWVVNYEYIHVIELFDRRVYRISLSVIRKISTKMDSTIQLDYRRKKHCWQF